MKIYIVRHGKTDWNVSGLIQGKTDIPLNKIGEKQAEIAKEKIEDKIDICFSSPLKRAIKTAQILSDVTPIIDKRLVERNMGEFEGKPALNYDSKKYWDYKSNYGDNGVEPIQDLFNRVNSFINEIKEKYSDKTILIVSHGATVRALHFALTSYREDEDFLKFDVPNCAIFKYDL